MLTALPFVFLTSPAMIPADSSCLPVSFAGVKWGIGVLEETAVCLLCRSFFFLP